MNFSYWEQQSWISNIDFLIVGSGIVGLNTALQLKTRFPESQILILERGLLPEGASTRNAGFACFGSLSEILDDLNKQSEQEVLALINRRIKGLDLLRENLGDHLIDYRSYGGYELFEQKDRELYENCISKIEKVNKMLYPVFKEDIFSRRENTFNFKNVIEPLIYSKFEGQINTGKMMTALLQKVQSLGVKILNNVLVEEFAETGGRVEVKTNKFRLFAGKIIIATNGFASQLGIPEVRPARAQVLITKPITNLSIKGTFHLDRGFYYFRNIDNRILFGGGRNLDIKGEETTIMEQTELIQNRLEEILKTIILPGVPFEIERRWSGIMGVGETKKPILKQLSENVYCGVRLGGMGVAIGSLVGKELADMV